MTPPAATGPGRTTSAEGPRAARARAGAASRPGTGRPWQGPAWLGPLAIAVAFAALAWASRGFTPGAAVADDYGFLFRHRFQHPLDLFDSMGARYYWRPLSRQGYFSLIGAALPGQPWVAAAANAILLVATAWLLYRVGRRALTPPVAATLAVIPLLSEPARALLVWPSGGQHLMGGAFAALALHEGGAGRRLSAALAGLAAVLSHESAVLALLALPLVARWRSGDAAPGAGRRAVLVMSAWVAGALAAWAAGYAVARGQAVVLPAPVEAGALLARVPALLALAGRAALDLEDVPARLATPALALFAGLGAATLASWGFRGARRRWRAYGPVILAGLAGFGLWSLPLSWLLPDWNAWRAWVPTLALLASLTLACAAASPWLAVGFAALRLTLLLVAAPGPSVVAPEAPATTSQMSFLRLVRLQRIAESARRSLTASFPALPQGACVRYWGLQHISQVAFAGPAALAVWYRDTTLTWSPFGGAGNAGQRVDAIVEFQDHEPLPGHALEPGAVRLYLAGGQAQRVGRWAAADSLYQAARAATRTRWALAYAICDNRARVAMSLDRPDRARAFMEEYAAIKGRDAEYWAVSAWIESARGRFDAALAESERCLALDPRNQECLQMAEGLRRLRRR